MNKIYLKKIIHVIKKKNYAVSPVIATLMLVLISVGASGSFYVWASGFQEDISEDFGTVKTTPMLTVGGSSLAHPFTEEANEYYKATHHLEIRNSRGGNNAGIIAVQNDIIDIACISRELTDDEKKDLEEFHIGNISISVVTHPDNPHHLQSINKTILRNVYEVNGGNGKRIPLLNGSGSTEDEIIKWNQLPSHSMPFQANGFDTSPEDYYIVSSNKNIFDYTENNSWIYALEEGEMLYNFQQIGNIFRISDTDFIIYTTASLQDNKNYSIYFCCDGLGSETIKTYDTNKDDEFEEFFVHTLFDTHENTFEDNNIISSQITDDYQSMKTEINQNQDSIGFLPTPVKDHTVHQLFEENLPLYYVTKKPTTGLRNSFIDYIRLPQINQEICNQIEYNSIYS